MVRLGAGRMPSAGVSAILRKLGAEVKGQGAMWGLAGLRRALLEADRFGFILNILFIYFVLTNVKYAINSCRDTSTERERVTLAPTRSPPGLCFVIMSPTDWRFVIMSLFDWLSA